MIKELTRAPNGYTLSFFATIKYYVEDIQIRRPQSSDGWEMQVIITGKKKKMTRRMLLAQKRNLKKGVEEETPTEPGVPQVETAKVEAKVARGGRLT